MASPARVDPTAHDTAISDAPAKTAVPAEYTWIQPRNRGLVKDPGYAVDDLVGGIAHCATL